MDCGVGGMIHEGLIEKDLIMEKFSNSEKEYDEIGLEFETYLMDKQHHCKNKS